ncbi:hypothetical protein U1Q18_030840 [Sarracenia purpurea var. burkii]
MDHFFLLPFLLISFCVVSLTHAADYQHKVGTIGNVLAGDGRHILDGSDGGGSDGGGRLTPKYTVHILNRFPLGGLTFHCKSGDDDLGEQAPEAGQEFNWTFRESIIGTTLFFCSFKFGGRSQTFNVFDGTIRKQCKQCYWLVNGDGFFFSNDNSSYRKLHDWNGFSPHYQYQKNA